MVVGRAAAGQSWSLHEGGQFLAPDPGLALPHAAATAYCQERGAHLAFFESRADFDHLARRLLGESKAVARTGVWIGARRAKFSLPFMWDAPVGDELWGLANDNTKDAQCKADEATCGADAAGTVSQCCMWTGRKIKINQNCVQMGGDPYQTEKPVFPAAGLRGSLCDAALPFFCKRAPVACPAEGLARVNQVASATCSMVGHVCNVTCAPGFQQAAAYRGVALTAACRLPGVWDTSSSAACEPAQCQAVSRFIPESAVVVAGGGRGGRARARRQGGGAIGRTYNKTCAPCADQLEVYKATDQPYMELTQTAVQDVYVTRFLAECREHRHDECLFAYGGGCTTANSYEKFDGTRAPTSTDSTYSTLKNTTVADCLQECIGQSTACHGIQYKKMRKTCKLLGDKFQHDAKEEDANYEIHLCKFAITTPPPATANASAAASTAAAATAAAAPTTAAASAGVAANTTSAGPNAAFGPVAGSGTNSTAGPGTNTTNTANSTDSPTGSTGGGGGGAARAGYYGHDYYGSCGTNEYYLSTTTDDDHHHHHRSGKHESGVRFRQRM